MMQMLLILNVLVVYQAWQKFLKVIIKVHKGSSWQLFEWIVSKERVVISGIITSSFVVDGSLSASYNQGLEKKNKLTIHGECHSLANGRRHVVASDAQIRSHLSPLDTMELQQRTVVGLVPLESVTTCAPRKRFLSAYFLENWPFPHLLPSTNTCLLSLTSYFLPFLRIAFIL